jgi:hypothetical protein
MSVKVVFSFLALASILTSSAAPALADEWRHEREVRHWELTHPNAIPVSGVVPVQSVVPIAQPVSVYTTPMVTAPYLTQGQVNQIRRQERRMANIQFAEWAQAHQQWVQMHAARARLFYSNPAMAERYRHEWYGARI